MDEFNLNNNGNQVPNGENNNINRQPDSNTYNGQQYNDNFYNRQQYNNTAPVNNQQQYAANDTTDNNSYNVNTAYNGQQPDSPNANAAYNQQNSYNANAAYNQQQSSGYNANTAYNRQNNSMNNQGPAGSVPEYSFWAEQMPGGNAYQGNSTDSQNNYGYHSQSTVTDIPEKPKKKHKAVKLLAKAACFGIIAALSFIGILAVYKKINPDAAISNIGYSLLTGNKASGSSYTIKSTEQGTINLTTSTAVSKVAEDAMPSIVSIHSVSTQTDSWFGQQYSSEGSGSGIIVGKNDKDNELLIATNNHVVEGTDKITVTFIDGKEIDAVIKGTDATADLAVISVDMSKMEASTKNQIKVATLGNSDNIKVGEIAIAIGNALDYGQSVTVGYISAKDRTVEVSDNYSSKKMVLLQTDAAINPGNSGGALLNANGEVIGINSVKYADASVEGMGYAIPISKATPIINELMKREVLKDSEKGFLGVGTADVTDEISKMYNIPIGVFVSEVIDGGAAKKAGMQKGDIITKINDTEISSRVQLKELISSIKAGTQITVTFMRNDTDGYKEQTLNVVLGTNSSTSSNN